MHTTTKPQQMPNKFHNYNTQPPGWVWGEFKNNSRQTLRYGSLYPEKQAPEAIVILLPGRSEFVEKYFETARDLARMNFAVWVIDWRGQGKSERPFRYPHRGNAPDFEEHVDDLNQFIEGYVKKAAFRPSDGKPIPLIMLAQSMGGNIGLRYLSAHPGNFKAAIVCAPMLGIKDLKILPLFLSVILVKILGSIFGMHSYAFGQKDWAPAERASTDKFSRDTARNAVHDSWYLADPALQVGGVTFGWLYHALKSCLVLSAKKTLAAINIPVLLAVAGREELVNTAAIRTAAKIIPSARLIEFPEAGHEILMEKDDIRDKLLTALQLLTQEILSNKP